MSALVSERYPLPKAQFLKTEFKAHRWENVEPILLDLERRPLGNAGELEQWLLDRSELDAQIAKHSIQWKWVKGHAGNEHNEIASSISGLSRAHWNDTIFNRGTDVKWVNIKGWWRAQVTV